MAEKNLLDQTKEQEAAEKSKDFVKQWLAELDSANKREKDFLKRGQELVDAYEAKKRDTVPFNILYANTMTMLPTLYSNTPVPVVERRFKDEDQLAKLSCDVARRVLSFELDTGFRDYTPFGECMKKATIEGLVPGRGVIRIKYDVVYDGQKIEESPAEQASEGVDAQATPMEAPAQAVKYEIVCPEHIAWDRIRLGYASRWADVPWLGIVHFMDRSECVLNFGAVIGNAIKLTVSGAKVPAAEDEATKPPQDSEGATLAEVWEIWDKQSREVVFVSPGYKEAACKRVTDPLELSGFYPTPQPLQFVDKISSMIPVPLFDLYSNQADELNRITVRLNALIKMCKVTGFYDSRIEGIQEALQKDDGILQPAENMEQFDQAGVLDKSIWMMPLDKIITVIQQLYVARTQCKQVIYEIMGLSDILRGSTAASETAQAQEIKSEWGSLRLQTPKEAVANYVRECLRIMAELSFTKFSHKTIEQMTGLKFPTQEDKQQAQAVVQQAQMQAQQAQIMAQQTGQSPPPTPQPPPEALQALSLPTWEEILGLLKDDIQRNYRIDIETNSTVAANATEDKKDVGDLLNAISQFFLGIGPLVEKGVMPFDAGKSILLAIIRRYKFGPEIEDQLKQLKAPQPAAGPDQPNAAEQAQQAADAQKAQNDMQLEKMRMVNEQQKIANETELAKQEMELSRLEAKARLQELDQNMRLAEVKFNAAMAQAKQKEAQARQPKPAAGGQ